MNRRLQQFLELEQLTPSRLADILGIQRSGLSHILSGRNKPGYEFIYKLLLKFPQLNSEWLITGKGKPYKDQQTVSSVAYNAPDTPPELPFFQPIQQSENSIEPPIPEEILQKRNVKRVTIFYSDGSFEEFYGSNGL